MQARRFQGDIVHIVIPPVEEAGLRGGVYRGLASSTSSWFRSLVCGRSRLVVVEEDPLRRSYGQLISITIIGEKLLERSPSVLTYLSGLIEAPLPA